MTKNKIKDFYVAGLLIGVMGGVIHDFLLLLLILAGLKTRTYWKDMAEVFFNPPQLFTWYAQLFGLIASLGLAGVSGILIALLLKVTGRDYLYIKSISASSVMGFAIFVVLYPALGLEFLQHSIITNYVAFFTFIFYGVVVGFLFDKFTDFKLADDRSQRDSTKNIKPHKVYLKPDTTYQVNPPAEEQKVKKPTILRCFREW
ncbi:MAG: hypothetical protein WCY82_02600 [Desulfotomaculaceae bacterium]